MNQIVLQSIIIILTTIVMFFVFLNLFIFHKKINNYQNIKTRKIKLNRNMNVNSWSLIVESNLQKNWMKISDEKSHALIVGGSGTGKTQKIILPFLYINSFSKDEPSFIINDLKGEIISKTKRFFQNQNYKIILLDFDKYSDSNNHFNPLNLIFIYKQNEDYCKTLVENLASFVFNEKDEKEKFWFKKCQEIFIGIIFLMIEMDIKENEFNFNKIIEIYLEIKKYSNLILNPKNKSNFYLKDFVEQNNIEKTIESIKITFKSEIIKYYSGIINKISKFSDFNLNDIVNKKTIIYIKNKGTNSLINNFISLIIDQINVFLLNQDDLSLKRPIINVLDEFTNFSKLENFNSWLSVSRQKNIWYLISIQNISSFEKIYGNMQEYTSNFNFDYFLGNSDINSFNYFVKGYKTKSKKEYEQEVDLISFNKFNTLKNKELILRVKGYKPKIRKMDYFFNLKIDENNSKKISKVIKKDNTIEINFNEKEIQILNNIIDIDNNSNELDLINKISELNL